MIYLINVLVDITFIRTDVRVQGDAYDNQHNDASPKYVFKITVDNYELYISLYHYLLNIKLSNPIIRRGFRGKQTGERDDYGNLQLQLKVVLE